MQILIASHVAPVRHTLRVLLEKEEHKVQLADSLQAAQEAIAKHLRFDVVICEWKLDEGKAVLLQRRCQQIDQMTDNGVQACAPHFIILATPKTGSGSLEDQSVNHEIQSFGFHDVFQKPVDRHALIQRMRAIAQERRPATSAASPPLTAVETISTAPTTESSPSPVPAPKISARRFIELEGEVVALRDQYTCCNKRLFELARALREMAQECDPSSSEDSAAEAEVRP